MRWARRLTALPRLAPRAAPMLSAAQLYMTLMAAPTAEDHHADSRLGIWLNNSCTTPKATLNCGTPPPQSVLDAALASAEEDDQPRVAEGSLGARSKTKAAPTFRETKRGSRGGRSKRKMPIEVTSEVSSDEGIDAVGRSA